MKKVLLFLFVCSISTAIFAQGGESALGVRLGGASGITYKHYGRTNKSAIEAIGAFNFDKSVEGVGLHLLFEKLAPLSGQRVNAIIGLGPSYVFGSYSSFGGTGIVGLDWRLINAIGLQVDWMPTYYFAHGGYFSGGNVAFSIRYTLNHKKLKR